MNNGPKSTFPRVVLATQPRPAASDGLVVYSTGPRTALGRDGWHYFLKGPDPVVVSAEAIGYALAKAVGLPTPQGFFTEDPATGDRLFACREVRTRRVDFHIQRGKYTNLDFFPNIIAFDIWIANEDRNVNNVVGDPIGGPDGDQIRLVAIDFEKSKVAREESRILLARHPPSTWWPKGDLARLLPRPLAFPTAMCDRIRRAGERDVHDVVLGIVHDSLSLQDAGALISHLTSRAAMITEMVQEVWHGKAAL